MSCSRVKWEILGEASLKRAREQNKPLYIFVRSNFSDLSYQMEMNSFVDDEVVKLLNEDFVSIRVDREEIPPLEEIAFITCKVMNGSGGFPLNIFATPDLKPFFAAGYMPNKGTPSTPGISDCLPRIKWLWLTENESVVRASEEIMQGVEKVSNVEGEDIPLEEAVKLAARVMDGESDRNFGGFGDGAKTPSIPKLLFLEEYTRVFEEDDYDRFIKLTLDSMSQKAIRDHLGGGFFSFSKNADWSGPVLEKTLASQAMMALAFAEGFDRYRRVPYWRAADEALAFISMNLYDPDRGFMSGWTAVSEDDGFYSWSETEVDDLLGVDGPIFRRSFCIEGDGCVPSMASSLESMAIQEGFSDPEDLGDVLAKGCQILSAARQSRPVPKLDSRVLTDWNGLAIVALARCGRLMDRPNYVHLAEKELSRIIGEEIVHCDGIQAFFNDYSFLIWGAVELYRSTDDKKWLESTLELDRRAMELFSCGDGFNVSSLVGEGMLFSRSSGQDGATPSGASVMAGNLISLWILTGEEAYLSRSRKLVKHFSGAIAGSPEGYPSLLTSVLRTMA